VLQNTLDHYIHVAQAQYFDHIRDKIASLRQDSESEGAASDVTSKITLFKIRLMEEALCHHPEVLQPSEDGANRCNSIGTPLSLMHPLGSHHTSLD